VVRALECESQWGWGSGHLFISSPLISQDSSYVERTGRPVCKSYKIPLCHFRPKTHGEWMYKIIPRRPAERFFVCTPFTKARDKALTLK
jgi:hypothetical protein